MMDSKEHRARQVAIANKVAIPTFTPKPKKSNVHRCEACKKVITGGDIKAYRAEAGKADPYGYPAVCEDCAEKEADRNRTVTIVEEPEAV